MKNQLNRLNDSFLKENECVFKKYLPLKKIGKGSFGNIYSAIRISDKTVFAMKTEKKSLNQCTLESEAYYLFLLKGFGIPKLISFGRNKKYNILIETLLDKSLFHIYIKAEKKCSEIDASLIALQVLDRLEWIHSKNFVYRDVKPENFMIGIEDPNIIYIIDFGICKKYRSSKTGKHILPRNIRKFYGTLKYASSNALNGKILSRRDDLISLGYMLVELIKKRLPWSGWFNNLNRKSYNELIRLKENDADGILFNNIPKEYVEYFHYVKNLKFEQKPNYSYLRSIFIRIISKKNLNYKELSFSWIDINHKKNLSLPKNNPFRRTNRNNRILNSLEKRRRINSEILEGIYLKNSIQLSNNKNNNNINITSKDSTLNRHIINPKLKLDNIELFLNSNDKEKNIKEKKDNPQVKILKRFSFNRKKNYSEINNCNLIINKEKINGNITTKNNENLISKKNLIQKVLKSKIEKIKMIKNSNLKINSHVPSKKELVGDKPPKINMNCANIFSSKKKEKLNLSNNIEYKSPFLKLQPIFKNLKSYNVNKTGNTISATTKSEKNNLLHYHTQKKRFKTDFFNKMIDENVYNKFQQNEIKNYFHKKNYKKDLNIIINNNIKSI